MIWVGNQRSRRRRGDNMDGSWTEAAATPRTVRGRGNADGSRTEAAATTRTVRGRGNADGSRTEAALSRYDAPQGRSSTFWPRRQRDQAHREIAVPDSPGLRTGWLSRRRFRLPLRPVANQQKDLGRRPPFLLSAGGDAGGFAVVVVSRPREPQKKARAVLRLLQEGRHGLRGLRRRRATDTRGSGRRSVVGAARPPTSRGRDEAKTRAFSFSSAFADFRPRS